MSTQTIQELTKRQYEAGFVTDVESEAIPPGLNEDVIRLISAKKGEPDFMLEWRLRSYRHWLTLKEPRWHKSSWTALAGTWKPCCASSG